MPKLVLKFEAAVLKEVPVGSQPVTIGRGPDNDIQIDNLAVSSHHAKVYSEEGKLVIEDLNSLNGTFINNQRIQRVALKQGDQVLIGKHHLVVDMGGVVEAPAIPERKVAAPKVEETMVLDTKKRKELLAQAMAQAGMTGTAPGATAPTGSSVAGPERTQQLAQAQPQRARPATLVILAGKTDQPEYVLSGKLTVIGKSDMATVKIRGWFKPKVAAQINKRDDGYYIGPADKTPSVNGQPIHGPQKLNEGDMIEVAGVRMNFVYKD